MPIPDYQTVMLPFLQYLSDQKGHHLKEIKEHLKSHFTLTDEETLQLLASGKSTIFSNRIGWARTYLKKAGLIEPESRGTHKITQRGLDLLKTNPIKIDNSVLKKYPEYLEFIGKNESMDEPESINAPVTSITPEESLEKSYYTIRKNIAQELLQKVKAASPAFFETLVVELLVKMGYGGSMKDAGKAIGKSGDEGIDGIIKEDRLG